MYRSANGIYQRAEVYAGGMHVATYNNSTTYFDHTDWTGTERARSDVNGMSFETCSSLPYGDAQDCTGSLEASPLHFTGKQRDIETGLDYFNARYYASTSGRFLLPDWSAVPVAVPYADLSNPQTLNLYTYVGNNPITHTDVDGHQEISQNGGQSCGDMVGVQPISGALLTAVCGSPAPPPEPSPYSAQYATPPQWNTSQLEEPPNPLEQEREDNPETPSAQNMVPQTGSIEMPWPPLNAIFPGQDGPLSKDHARNFQWYVPITLKEPQTYFRMWGEPANLEGRDGTYYSVSEPFESEHLLRDIFSIAQEWNSLENLTPVTIPSGTTVYMGPASAQEGYAGGGLQVYVPRK